MKLLAITTYLLVLSREQWNIIPIYPYIICFPIKDQ